MNIQQNKDNFVKFRNINNDCIAKFESELEILFERTLRYIDEAPRVFTIFITNLMNCMINIFL